MKIRKPVVAGQFYPGNRDTLMQMLNSFFGNMADRDRSDQIINALIVPHAGYIFSGKQAAKAYRYLIKDSYDLVCIISPSHREYFPAISVYPGDAYNTPLGTCPVHTEARELALSCEGILSSYDGHRAEHALEVQLPFIQYWLKEIPILPMVMGDQGIKNIDQLAVCVKKLFDRYANRILFVASSDLSHFHSAEIAKNMDGRFIELLDNANINEIYEKLFDDELEACGGGPILSILKGLSVEGEDIHVMGYSHSGEVLQDNDSVVGYTSAVIIKHQRNNE